MKIREHRRQRPKCTVTAPAASGDARQGEEPLPAWDRRTWLVAIPLALFVVAAFIPVLKNGFVGACDDDDNFLNNPFYRGLGAAQLRWACTTFWVGVYQPLAWLLFEVQYVIWKLDPRGYHLTSLVFHAADAVVLYALTVAVLVRCPTDFFPKSPWTCSLGAGLATALFMVHPLRVEAVAWASCQPYLPCAFFSMLAVIAYLRAFPVGSPPRWGWIVGAFVLFVAALLSKAVAVSLPVVLLILDVYPLRRLGNGPGGWFGPSARRVLLEKVPFVMVTLVFMGLAIAAKPQTRVNIKRFDTFARVAQACYAPWFYIKKTVLPLDLIAFYPTPSDMNWLAPTFLFGILATLAMSALLFVLRRRWPGLLAVWLCYLVILAPNSGIVQISNQIAADRYCYVAMLGWVILAAACLCRLFQTSSWVHPGAIRIVALCLGAILVFMTWDQCRTWRDSESLWTHALNHGGGSSFVVHNNLGIELAKEGKSEEATAHFIEALRLNPEHADAHNNLGVDLAKQGNDEAAAAHFTEALSLNPGFIGARNNLALLRYRQGRADLAAALYTEALRLDPANAAAHNTLAAIMATWPEAKYRDGKRAVESATRACELTEWKVPECLSTLAAAYAEAGDFAAAVKWQLSAIELPRDQQRKDDYRSRLELYQARKPYREAPPAHAPTEARP